MPLKFFERLNETRERERDRDRDRDRETDRQFLIQCEILNCCEIQFFKS